MVAKVHCGPVLGVKSTAMLKIRPPKQSHNALDNHLDPVFRTTSKWPIYMLHYGHYFCYWIFLTLRYPTSYSGYRHLCNTDTRFFSLAVLLRTFDHFITKWPLQDFNNQKYKTLLHALVFSDFVKGESWDSSSEKRVPVQNKSVPVNESEIENTLGLYVACARLSDSILGTYKNEQSENKTHDLGKGAVAAGKMSLPSPRSFFAFLITERLSSTISEPGTGQAFM